MTTPAPAPIDTADASTPLEIAFLLFRDEGLRLPPVPREMIDSLARLGPWRFGAPADDLPSLDDRAAWEQRLHAGTLPNHVHFGHIGHGLSSWSLVYSLVLDSVAIYLRMPYGNAFGNAAAARVRVNAAVMTIEELVVLADDARDTGRLHHGERVVVIEDATAPGSGFAVGSPWNDAEAALSMARTALRP